MRMFTQNYFSFKLILRV